MKQAVFWYFLRLFPRFKQFLDDIAIVVVWNDGVVVVVVTDGIVVFVIYGIVDVVAVIVAHLLK